MEIGEEITLPLYITNGNNVIATGSVHLHRVSDVLLVGDFSFYAPEKKPWDITQAMFNLSVIHGAGRDIVRTPLGSVDFKRDGDLLLSFASYGWSSELDSALADPRSIAN